MDDFSTILFARPSYAEGAARILDFANTLTDYNQSLSPEDADAAALWADWMAIRGDAIRSLQAIHVEAIRAAAKAATTAANGTR
ncbi:MAG: hypothetical protein WD063_00835 [Pirellulales bacterium]